MRQEGQRTKPASDTGVAAGKDKGCENAPAASARAAAGRYLASSAAIIPRLLRAAQVQRQGLKVPRPARDHLLSSPAPYLHCYGAMQVPENTRLGCHAASSRNTFGKCAKDGQSVGMHAAVGAPYQGHVVNVVALQLWQVRPVMRQFLLDHCLCVET